MSDFEEIGTVELDERIRWRVWRGEKGWHYIFEEYKLEDGNWKTNKSKEKKNPYMLRISEKWFSKLKELDRILCGGQEEDVAF